MKKALSMILALVMSLSLCACGGGIKITEKEVEKALADCDGVLLDLEESDGGVTSFTYVVSDVNAEDLLKRTYVLEAVDTVLAGDSSQIRRGQLKVVGAFVAVMEITSLFTDEDVITESGLENILSIICDGKIVKYDGWSVSAEVDTVADKITIMADSK